MAGENRKGRIFGGLALAAALAVTGLTPGLAPSAHAQALARPSAPVSAYECAWRALPVQVRVDLTSGLRTIQDLNNLGPRLARLTEEDALRAGQACGLDFNAEIMASRFGAFLGAKTIMVALGARLQTDLGVHDGQLEIFASGMTAQQRRAMVEEMMAGRTPSLTYLQAVNTGVLASGVDASNTELLGLAAAYAMARVTVEELGAW